MSCCLTCTPPHSLLSLSQDPLLREKFTGQPEHVINYLFLLAEEVRQIMSKMRFRTFQEMVGRTDKLRFAPKENSVKAATLDFAPILTNALSLRPGVNIRGGSLQQEFNMDKRLVGGAYMGHMTRG